VEALVLVSLALAAGSTAWALLLRRRLGRAEPEGEGGESDLTAPAPTGGRASGRGRLPPGETAGTEDTASRILESITDPVFHLDRTFRFVYVNPAGRDLLSRLDLDPDGVYGRTPWEVLPSELSGPARRALETARETGEPLRFPLVLRERGFWLEVHVYPSPDGLSLYLDDVTEERTALSALRESETRFQAVVETLAEGLMITDPGGLVLYANPRITEMTGYSLADLIGLPIPDTFVPAELWTELTARLEESDRKRVRSFDFPIVARSGEVVWTEVHGGVLRNVRGERIGTLLAFNDITERKLAEDALAESEERFRVLVEHAPEAIVVLDVDNRSLLAFNENAVHLYGRSREELSRSFPPDLSPPVQPDGRPSPEAAWDYISRALDGEAPVFEWIHTRGDGTEVPCEVRLVRLPAGDRRLVRGSVFDITERKRAEAALRESEERYRSLFEDDVAGNFIVTAEGEIVACNRAWARILGFESAEEAIGVQMDPFYPREGGRSEFIELLRKERKLEYHEVELVRPDGRRVFILANVRGIFDEEGRLTHVVGHGVDATEVRNLRRQLHEAQKMEAVGRLAGGIAHDFNNLLTAIGGHAELLLSDPNLPDHIRQDLREIRWATNRAADLTQQLLAFGRRQVLKPTLLDLNRLVREAMQMLHRVIGEDVRVELHAAPYIWPVRADPTQLHQVLMNLVVNARDAMPRGGRLTLRTENLLLDEEAAAGFAEVPPGPYAVLSVSDTGEGIPESVMDLIFEPFFTTKEQGKGSGLGLSTVYGIVKQSGGHILVESEPGVGTTFRVLLPRADGEVPPEKDEEEEGRERMRGGRETGTILLVEDEDVVRSLAGRVLERHGYRVVPAANAARALEVVEDPGVELTLLLTDLVLPDMSGWELAGRARQIRPELPLLFMSGYPEGAVPAAGERPAAFLPKPFNAGQLLHAVREALTPREEPGERGSAEGRAG